MIDIPKSEGLRVALRSGAEIGLARAMSKGSDPQTVGTFIEARLGALSETDKSYISNLAKSILDAASAISVTGEGEDIEPDDIPTNGDLFGGEWEGKRLFWFGEWTIPGSDEWHKFSGTLPDISSYPDIVTYAAGLASSYIEAYPGKFIGELPSDPGTVTVRIIGIEKAF